MHAPTHPTGIWAAVAAADVQTAGGMPVPTEGPCPPHAPPFPSANSHIASPCEVQLVISVHEWCSGLLQSHVLHVAPSDCRARSSVQPAAMPDFSTGKAPLVAVQSGTSVLGPAMQWALREKYTKSAVSRARFGGWAHGRNQVLQLHARPIW